jgi:hypothetical protein
MKAFLLLYGICCVLGILAIVLIGYQGDGRKGVPTAFGRYERASQPQIARGWR